MHPARRTLLKKKNDENDFTVKKVAVSLGRVFSQDPVQSRHWAMSYRNIFSDVIKMSEAFYGSESIWNASSAN